MSLLTEMLKFMISYVIVIIVAIFGMAFLMRGLFFPYLRTKLSAGRKILVEVLGYTYDYFRVGSIEEGFLVYKDRKETKRIAIPKGKHFIGRKGTVPCIRIDDETGAVLTINLEGVEGHDPVKTDSLFKRCLYKPPVFDNKEKLILITLVLAVLGIIMLGWGEYQILKQITALKGI